MNECRGLSQRFFYRVVAASCSVDLPAELPSMKICDVSESLVPVESGMGRGKGVRDIFLFRISRLVIGSIPREGVPAPVSLMGFL